MLPPRLLSLSRVALLSFTSTNDRRGGKSLATNVAQLFFLVIHSRENVFINKVHIASSASTRKTIVAKIFLDNLATREDFHS
jgi:hypothetical protein